MIRRPCKVLHVVRSMDRGGVETWLMNVLRNIDRSRFEFHFLVNDPAHGAYDDEILRLGAVIHRGPNPHNLVSFTSYLSRMLRAGEPFDAVHSHLYWYSGIVMKVAQTARVPVRIAHSHTSRCTSGLHLARRSYENLMRSALAEYATHRIAVSRQAGEALFGRSKWAGFQILYYGMDFSRFGALDLPEILRQRLGIPADRMVIGHVGRFVRVKNHRFLLEVFHALGRQRDAHLLLVGNGPLLSEIEAQSAAEGLSDRCTFAGLREDVAPCIGAMDVLLLPSLWEGLPLVTLEAQAAGVRVLASTAVSNEIEVLPGAVEHLPLDAGCEVWATAAVAMAGKKYQRRSSARLMSESRFGIERCLSALEDIYGHAQQSPATLQGAIA